MNPDEYIEAYGHMMTDEQRLMIRFASSFVKPKDPPGGRMVGGDKPSCSRGTLMAWISGEFIPPPRYRCGGGDAGNATLSDEILEDSRSASEV